MFFGTLDGREEGAEFLRIQVSVGAHARAEIQAEGNDCLHGLADIARIESADKVNQLGQAFERKGSDKTSSRPHELKNNVDFQDCERVA